MFYPIEAANIERAARLLAVLGAATRMIEC
jgi:hypothetical protein